MEYRVPYKPPGLLFLRYNTPRFSYATLKKDQTAFTDHTDSEKALQGLYRSWPEGVMVTPGLFQMPPESEVLRAECHPYILGIHATIRKAVHHPKKKNVPFSRPKVSGTFSWSQRPASSLALSRARC